MGTVLFHLVHRQHNSKPMTSHFSGPAELGGKGAIVARLELYEFIQYVVSKKMKLMLAEYNAPCRRSATTFIENWLEKSGPVKSDFFFWFEKSG